MQSIRIKYPGSGYIAKAIEILIISFLLFLSYYQYRFLDTTMVKLGMSHLFSPGLVGFLTYFLLILNIVSAICLIFWASKMAVIPALVVFSFYTIYSAILFVQTGSDCGCSNIFFDIDLKRQMVIGTSAIVLSLISFYQRSQVR